MPTAVSTSSTPLAKRDDKQKLCSDVTHTLESTGLENLLKPKPCKECKFCLCKQDCGECVNCADKLKFGGKGRRNKKCINRECEVVAEYKLNKARQKKKRKYALMPVEEKDTLLLQS